MAHAIELGRGVSADDQGEAVALGMMAAAYLAARQGRIPGPVVDQHRQVIAGLGLPVHGEFRLHGAVLPGAAPAQWLLVKAGNGQGRRRNRHAW